MKHILSFFILLGVVLSGASQKQGVHFLKSEFKNIRTFTRNGTFTPPPGVTRLMVEMWGGGGGGTVYGGGGGGAYFLGFIDIAAGSSIEITVGMGGTGSGATFSGSVPASNGTPSRINYRPANNLNMIAALQARGGSVFIISTSKDILGGNGGIADMPNNNESFITEPGEDGEVVSDTYYNVNNQTVGMTRNFGKGGNAGGTSFTGGRGRVHQEMNLPTQQVKEGNPGKMPGGGGGGGSQNLSTRGAQGLVNIYY